MHLSKVGTNTVRSCKYWISPTRRSQVINDCGETSDRNFMSYQKKHVLSWTNPWPYIWIIL